jgi:hypothetical protein
MALCREAVVHIVLALPLLSTSTPSHVRVLQGLFPRQYGLAVSQTRSLLVTSRRVLSRVADAAVLVITRVLPFLAEAQAQVRTPATAAG